MFVHFRLYKNQSKINKYFQKYIKIRVKRKGFIIKCVLKKNKQNKKLLKAYI